MSWRRTVYCARQQLIAALYEAVKVGGGRIVSLQPRAAVMPLVAVTMTEAEGKDWRSHRAWAAISNTRRDLSRGSRGPG